MAQPPDHAGVRFPPPFVFLGFLMLGLLLDRLGGWPKLPPALYYPGIAVVLAGLGLLLSALSGFRRAGTRPEPWQPSSSIVEHGPYRFTRNPMYLGMALLMLGLALIAASTAALALVPVAVIAIDRCVIVREEAYLQRKFGDAYGAYCGRVRRWL